MTVYDTIQRVFREFKRYTGDGLPNEPVNAALPVGDPQSGVHNPMKSSIRAALTEVAEASDDAVAATTAAQAAAEAARDAAEGAAETVVVARYNSKAGVEAATIAAAVKSIELTGYAAAGDGGGFDLYARVDSEPSHEGKIRSTDRFLSDGTTDATNGGWWELSSRTPSVGTFGLLDSNTESSNETALALLETFDRKAFDLGRDIPLPADTYPQKLLQGNGRVSKGGEPFPYNVPGQSARDYLHRGLGRIGNIDQLSTAIRSGTVRVALVGDSITEGLSQISYEDSLAGLFETYLRTIMPDVTVEVANFAIAGTVLGQFNSDTYVGAASEGAVVPGSTFYKLDGYNQFPANTTLWPGGSTESKPWHEHVEDWAPDLVLIAFGMNTGPDGATNTYDNSASLANIIDGRMAGWAEPPSVAIVTPMLPTRDSGSGASTWTTVQAIADMMRGMAAEKDLTLLDANALCRSYLDGVDVTRTRRRVITGFDDYADWITLSGTRPSVVSGELVFAAAGWVYRPTASPDFDFSYVVELGGNDVCDLSYRAITSSPGTGYLIRIRNNGGTPGFVWYYLGTALESGALTPAASYKVRVKVNGAYHQVWVNDVKVIDSFNYRYLEAGYHGLSADTEGGGFSGVTVSDLYAGLGYPAVIGHPIFSEEDLLGMDDFDEDWSLGGNGVNHPGILGHRALYFDACAPLFRAIEQSLAAQPPSGDVLTASSTAISMALGDYIEVGIAGAYSSQVAFMAGTATELGGSAFHSTILTGVDSAAITLRKNGSSLQINEAFNFPHSGSWLVTVMASVTFDDPNPRTNLVATAVQVR